MLAIALKLVRDAAFGQMTKIAAQWLDIDSDRPSDRPGADKPVAAPAYQS